MEKKKKKKYQKHQEGEQTTSHKRSKREKTTKVMKTTKEPNTKMGDDGGVGDDQWNLIHKSITKKSTGTGRRC